VNVEGTLNLAHQAVLAGVSRFIFISSIKVNGESTTLEFPFHADNYLNPQDPYGISKMEAEQGLKKIASQSNMEVVIIRPPLVYGPGVKANFFTMMNWLNKGIPLPLGAITKNRRSFVFLDNLISLILTCINNPAAANQILLVSDDEDLSTTGLLARMAVALGKPSKLIAIPVVVITAGSKLIGKSDISQRICGSLQVDIKKTKELLGWAPPVSVDEGLRQTAAHFLKM
jgi:nucleoside-diphosphate-sugar epimerase